MSETQLNAIRAACEIILDAVKAAGSLGAPGGIIYAGLMSAGCTLEQYECLMSGLVRVGRLRKAGECYYIAEEAISERRAQ